MAEKPVTLLTPELMTTTGVESWVSEVWSSGFSLLPLAEMYLTNAEPTKPHEVAFLRRLSELLAAELPARLRKLSRAHGEVPIGLCLTGALPEVRMEGSKLLAALQSLVEKLRTETGEPLKEGVMSMLVSDHVYHKCLWCDATMSFSLSDPLGAMMVPKAYVEVSVTGATEFGKWAQGRWSPSSMQAFAAWRRFIGVCKRCNYNCSDCGTMGPKMFSLEWMQSLKNDKICPDCGQKLLANVKPPVPGRRELIALHRKSFLDL
jgi:DNA-directed RNA polymerase subunit RPC12/RpoP